MSIRSLIEINHDFTHELEANPRQFMILLARYLKSGSTAATEGLHDMGVRVIASRHHSSEYRIPEKTNGFAQTPEPGR